MIMSTIRRLLLSLIVVAVALPAPVGADDAEGMASVVDPPEETMLLRYLPKGQALLGETFQASWADHPWWGAGSEFLKKGIEGINWDIADEEIARIRKEIESIPFAGPALVYECSAKWVVDPRTVQRRLHVTSPPKRLDVDERGLLRGGKLTWQPNLWRGDYSWFLEKGKEIKELAGEYERLTGDLEKAKVPSASAALTLAAKVYGSDFGPPHAKVEQLERAVIDQRGFAKRGELIWIVRSTEGRRGNFGLTWDSAAINAQTAVAKSSTDGKPRSVAEYLPDAENK
jgi:hypothetical protein